MKKLINYLPIGLLTIITVAAGAELSSSATVFGAGEVSDSVSASITVGAACSLIGTVDVPHTTSMANGAYQSNIGTTTLKTICNDANGYALYAVGYTDDTLGSTVLASTNGQNISTGLANTGNSSAWAMKVSSVAGAYTPTIQNGFNSYSTVPNTYVKVADYLAATDNNTGSSVQTTYAVYISPVQGAGTYEGKVKYTLVNPSTATPPIE